jgi:hypothetical protein
MSYDKDLDNTLCSHIDDYLKHSEILIDEYDFDSKLSECLKKLAFTNMTVLNNIRCIIKDRNNL